MLPTVYLLDPSLFPPCTAAKMLLIFIISTMYAVKLYILGKQPHSLINYALCYVNCC